MENIDYSQIDENCVDFVKFFNKIGLETEMCCSGHFNSNKNKYWISFSQNVTDDKIIEFISKFEQPFYAVPYFEGGNISGKFVKVFYGFIKGKQFFKWKYICDFSPNYEANQKMALRDLKIFKSVIYKTEGDN